MLIIPWAIPGFLSLLVWAGLLNDQFGVVNHVFRINVPWLFDVNLGRAAYRACSSAPGSTPVFFVVSMGALQSIPEESPRPRASTAAAPSRSSAASTLPLLLVAVGPLLSRRSRSTSTTSTTSTCSRGAGRVHRLGRRGRTDILISYTYKLAIASGLGNDYGLAAAITIIIFVITAGISTMAFARTRVLEEVV